MLLVSKKLANDKQKVILLKHRWELLFDFRYAYKACKVYTGKASYKSCVLVSLTLLCTAGIHCIRL